MIHFTSVNEQIAKTLDPSNKVVVCHYLSVVSYINSLKPRNYTLRILNEALVSNQIVFYFTKNFFLVDEFNEKISLFKANGLINFWMSRYAGANVIKKEDIPTKLTLINMQGTFELFLYGLTVAIILFVNECFVNRYFC